MTFSDNVLAQLEQQASPQAAAIAGRFFKTAEGQYGAGDIFIGVRVPAIRAIARQFQHASLADIEELLESPIHEMRLLAVIVMAEQAKRAPLDAKKALYDLYLHRTDCINNWDIVDSSCRDVVGGYLLLTPRHQPVLQKLAASPDVWERRIAMVSTSAFIRLGRLELTFTIASQLLSDTHDLIHKAVGWMLREAGKKDARQLHAFLEAHAHAMPRTALRYAIERFAPDERAYYLSMKRTTVN